MNPSPFPGLMHTLFALEGLCGLTIENKEGIVSFRFDPRKDKDAARITDMVTAWADVSAKYRNGDMSREDYDTWRYSYPAHDNTRRRRSRTSLRWQASR